MINTLVEVGLLILGNGYSKEEVLDLLSKDENYNLVETGYNKNIDPRNIARMITAGDSS